MGIPIIDTNVLNQAIKEFGVESQMCMLIEEMAELTQAVLKFRRANIDEPEKINSAKWNVAEESADVFITLLQLLYIMNFPKSFNYWVNKKINRLKALLKTDDLTEREDKNV